MRVVLTGFMGTGKSAAGRRIAERLGRRFIDTDELIESGEGLPVREIFARKGEPYFREQERRAVREACAGGDVVIATGGGTILDPQNLAALQGACDRSLMICLDASPAAIARRVRSTVAERPLLRGHPSLTARIRELYAERAPAYARVAIRIDTSGLTVEQVADSVIAALLAAERSDDQSSAAR